ncbi:MAG: hypothetical protein PHI23_03115 [Candidatus Peribacteraceae bacterium]|nr:hypothetical protein [Candidatus Peribacteraceae bacterium]
MPPLLISLISWTLFILVFESLLWVIFRRKLVQICLPTEPDRNIFHFFTIGRMWIIALLHTVFLCAVVIIGHLTLWS